RSFEQPLAEALEPRRLARGAQRRKPHLPVEPRLMWRNHRRRAPDVAWLVLELVRQPSLAIVRSFDDDFGPRGGHDRKEAVAVHAPERLDEARDRLDERRARQQQAGAPGKAVGG